MNNIKKSYMTVYSMSCSPYPGYIAAGNNYGVICIFRVTEQLSNSMTFNELELQMEHIKHPDEVEMKESKQSDYMEFTDEILNTLNPDDCVVNGSHIISGPEEIEQEKAIESSAKFPILRFAAHAFAVFALASTKDLLISGSIGELRAWRWDDILSGVIKCIWCITLPQRNNLILPEVNSLGISSIDDTIVYAGCGNDNIYCLDIVTRKILLTFSGHSDHIHCLKVLKDSRQFFSGSEDGSIRLWDPVKGKEAVSIIEPYKHEKLYRHRCGKRIGCIDVDDNNKWMVCGGGPFLSLWDLRSLLPSTVFSKPVSQFYVARFHNDYIFSGGSENRVSHWNLTGDLKVEVPTTACCVFDLQVSPSPNQMLLASGASYKINVFKDFRVKSFSLYNEL